MQVGDIVKATKGKAKESFFVVVKIEDGFAYIANGKQVSVFKPKKKNFKHIQKVSKQRFLLSDEKDIKVDAAVRKYLKTQKERICQKKM